MATFQQQQEQLRREAQRGLMLGGIDSNEYEPTQPYGLDALGYDPQVELEERTRRVSEWHAGRTRAQQHAGAVRNARSDQLAQLVSTNLAAATSTVTAPAAHPSYRLVPSAGCVDCDNTSPKQQAVSETHVWLSEHRRVLTQTFAAVVGILALTLV